mmetsp:Transcript_18149/g.38805  ORF Transcript_18149/g.38805 Transcript_18149/m.38805 type:complete len:792 (+) Transcript_18149:36-2411(+)
MAPSKSFERCVPLDLFRDFPRAPWGRGEDGGRVCWKKKIEQDSASSNLTCPSLASLGPDRIVVAGSLERPAAARRPIVAAHLEGDRALCAVDVGGVEPPLAGDDVHARSGVHTDALADLAEGLQLLADLGSAVGPVAPEDGWNTAVREQEGISPADLVVVSKLAPDDLQVASVVILNKGHTSDRIGAHDAGKSTTAIETPEVVGVDRILECVVDREVIDGCHSLSRVDVIAQDLHIPVPILCHCVGGSHASDVLFLDPSPIAEDKIQTDGSETDLFDKPLHVGFRVFLDLLVRVVDVWGVFDVLARGLRTLTEAGGVVPADGPALPIRLLEDSPLTVLVLLLGAAVVDHDVGDGANARLVHRRDQRLQLFGGAVLAVQVVPSARQVASVVDALRGGREPDHVDARLLHVGHLAGEDLVPAILVVAAVPVEGLQHDVRVLVVQTGSLEHRLRLRDNRFATWTFVLAVLHAKQRVGGFSFDFLNEFGLRHCPRHCPVREMNGRNLVAIGLTLLHFRILPTQLGLVLAVGIAADDGSDALRSRLGLALKGPVDAVGRHGGTAEVHRRLPGEFDEVRRGGGDLQPCRGSRLAGNVRLDDDGVALLGLRALHVHGGDLVLVLNSTLEFLVFEIPSDTELVHDDVVPVDPVATDLRLWHSIGRIPAEADSGAADLGGNDKRWGLRRAQLLFDGAVLKGVLARLPDVIVLVAWGLVPASWNSIVADKLDTLAGNADEEATILLSEFLSRKISPNLRVQNSVVDSWGLPASEVEKLDITLCGLLLVEAGGEEGVGVLSC